MYQLILASESPRRRELLEKAGFFFSVLPVKISEIPNKSLSIDEQILDIARRKSDAAYAELKSSSQVPFIILASDTEVVLDNETLGKPLDEQHACQMLRRLSGKAHHVKTAIQMIESKNGERAQHLETTIVHFRQLSDREIKNYVASKEPLDKAGAYGIQGLGSQLVERFEGDFENVVGLPVSQVIRLLKEKNWQVEKK